MDAVARARARRTRRLLGYPVAILIAAALLYAALREPREEPLYANAEAKVFELAGEGRFDEARAAIEDAAERWPKEVRIPLLRGWLEDGTGDLDAAYRAYESALPLLIGEEQKRSVQATLADIDRRRGRFAAARARLDALEMEFGLGERGGRALVLLLLSTKKVQEASSVIKRLVEEHPESVAVQRLDSQVARLLTHEGSSEGEDLETPRGGSSTDGDVSTLTTPK